MPAPASLPPHDPSAEPAHPHKSDPVPAPLGPPPTATTSHLSFSPQQVPVSSPQSSPLRAEYAPSPLPMTNNYDRDSTFSPPVDYSQRNSVRPVSMVQAYVPPVMDVGEDTIPELQPIFTLLNSHANKLYQEGYFLKLDDQNTRTSAPFRRRGFILTRVQRGAPTPTEHGPSALPSWSAPCCPSGTPPSWMLQVRTARCCPSSLT